MTIIKTVDLHSHLLPALDDGAKDIETSINMLNIYKQQGITDVFATPHFIPMEMSLEDFLESREKSYKALLKETKKYEGLPKVHLGGEIHYFLGLGSSLELDKLKLMGTKYILIELPIEQISNYLIEDIKKIKKTSGLTPIIAHVERMSFQKGYKKLLALIESGEVLAQVNASSFFNKKYKRNVLKLLKKDLISFVATDAHSDIYRRPILEDALNFIKYKAKYETYNKIRENISGLIFLY